MSAPWNVRFGPFARCESGGVCAANFTERFLTIMKECIPHRYLRKRRNLPWLTKSIIQLI